MDEIRSTGKADLLSRGRPRVPGAAGRARTLKQMAERAPTTKGRGGGKQKRVAQLWADAAHDLRQPVQAALLVTRMLEAESTGLAQKRAARHIANSLESLSEILEILTLLSRIEAGLQVVPVTFCQLSDVLQPTLREVTEIAAGRGIPLQLRGIRGVVRSNPRLLAVAARSLILNAIKFGSGRRILVCCRKLGDQLKLEVQFRGASLDGGNQSKAFIQLSPLVDRQSPSQLGLGLSLLKHLCQRLGHTLNYTKLPKQGQLLALRVPLAPSSL
jgi:signal transduction histidine kinase